MTTRSILTLNELLRRGRERILQGWTQHAPARTAKGTMCGANDPAAVAWCATGAAWYSDDTVPSYVSDPCYALYLEALAELRRTLDDLFPDKDYAGRLGPWNDALHRAQADVVRLYDETLARVEARADAETRIRNR